MLVFADLDYWLFICLVCLKRSEFFDAFFLQLMKFFFNSQEDYLYRLCHQSEASWLTHERL